jgi:hypothetical protein
MTYDHRAQALLSTHPRARFSARLCTVAAIAAAIGCSDESLDLGQEPLAVDRSSLSSYLAIWDGYTEAFTFDSGSDRVRLSLAADGSGSLVFGDGEPPVTPTDPDDPFPGRSGTLDETGLFMLPTLLLEGFPYSIGARVEAERIRAKARGGEQFDAACELQTPIADDINPGIYSCLPNAGGAVRNGECFLGDAAETPVSCGKLELCMFGRNCECDATACTGVSGDDIEFDAALDDTGSHLAGTVRVPFGSGSATVRLTRAEP